MTIEENWCLDCVTTSSACAGNKSALQSQFVAYVAAGDSGLQQ